MCYNIQMNITYKETRDILSKKHKEDNNCIHKHWIARCSHCAKILASDTHNSTEKNIKKIVDIWK